MTQVDWTPLLGAFGFVVFWAFVGVLAVICQKHLEQVERANDRLERIATALETLTAEMETPNE